MTTIEESAHRSSVTAQSNSLGRLLPFKLS